ncbi:MAG: hypothetical protein IJP70_07240 [Bacteroidales bacterium]|nr:hypothetical protein [Bacteroidales bacterium]
MAKNDKKLTVASKEDYTFQMLLNDIQESALVGEEDSQAGDKAERERQSKLIVLQMLIDRANEYNDESHRDDEKLRNAIDVKVNNDVYLAGFIFYISQNPQFDYSWNYLRKRGNSYKEFLVEGIRFLDNVLADINMLAGKSRTHKDVHVVMNDIIDVSVTGEKPFVKACVLWENFHRIASIKRDYNFTVKSKECILIAGKRKKAADAERLIDAALVMLNNTEGSTE